MTKLERENNRAIKLHLEKNIPVALANIQADFKKKKFNKVKLEFDQLKKFADEALYFIEEIENQPKKVFNVTYYDSHNEVIDSTQIDEKSRPLAWELFKEFGHTRKKGTYLEFEETTED